MKKLFSVILSIACIMQCCLFTVVAEGTNWTVDVNIKMLAEEGITAVNDPNFNPDGVITRAELFTLAAKLAGYSKFEEFTAKFKDMNGSEWYAPYVQHMNDGGFITEGILQEKQFKGDIPVTRELLATTFVKIAKPEQNFPVETTLFDDHHEISHWAQRTFGYALHAGWMKGVDDLHLAPKAEVTNKEAIDTLRKVYKVTGILGDDSNKTGDAEVKTSEYSENNPDNYVKAPYSDKSSWEYSVKGGAVEAGYADAKSQILQGEGSSPEDGCIFYDIKTSGFGVINALQMKYIIDVPGGIQTGRKYICGFKAKLVDENPAKEASLKFNVAKLRDLNDNNMVWSEIRTFSIIESDEYLNYEIEFVANSDQDVVVLLYQFGGDEQEKIKAYFDDFYWVPGPMASLDNNEDTERVGVKDIKTLIADDTSVDNVQLSGAGTYDTTFKPELVATTTKESGLLLDYWLDPYRNKISPNSSYTPPAYNSYVYRAGFAPYKYQDKNLPSAKADNITVTTGVPSINRTTASVNGKVALPDGYRLMDAGTIFYGGYWTENFNLFSENIKTVPAYAVTDDGEFTSQAFMNTRYGVLARTYAIIENPQGNVMVQYSDTEYMHSPSRPEKIAHHGIIYHELLGLFTGSIPASPERCIQMVDELKRTGADIVTVTPSEWKFNTWNSRTDGYWTDYAKYSAPKQLSYAQEVVDYVLDGGDPVQETLDGMRENDLYMFIDQRMNDHHYNNDLLWNTHSTFWKNNPKYWREDRNVGEYWDETPVEGETSERLFNYLNPEVQDYYYTLIEELVTDYDVDGLQMDFDRYYIYFQDQEEEMGMEVLTEFVGRVREMVNRKSIDTGRDLQISVRLEDTVDKVYSYGMDVEEWTRRDYVDILNVGDHGKNHFFVDIEGFKSLANNAKVFGEVHYLTYQGAAVGGTTTGVRRHITEHIAWATAKNFYDRGADGISFFNMQYCPDAPNLMYPHFTTVFDPELLETVEKNYVFTQGKGTFGFGTKADLDFKFPITEDPTLHKSIIARVEYTGKDATGAETEFILNGVKLKQINRSEVELFPAYSSNTAYATINQCKFFEIPLSAMINGENHFVIKTTKRTSGSGVIACLQIAFYNN